MLSRASCHLKQPDLASLVELTGTGQAIHLGLGINHSIRIVKQMVRRVGHQEGQQVSNKGDSGCFGHNLPVLSPAAKSIVSLTADRLYMLVTACIPAACPCAELGVLVCAG